MTRPIPYAAPIFPVQSVLDEQGNVLGDVNCVRCGYNVRGLPGVGNCPECGTKISASLRGTFLRFSDPAWVGKLAKGVRLMIWGVGIMIVLGLLSFGIAVSRLRSILNVSMAMNLCGYALWVWGTWLLTEPDPSGKGEEEYGTSRKIIRICMALGVFSHLFNFIERISPIPAAIGLEVAVMQAVFGIVGIVGIVAELQYISKLAGRVPDYGIARRASFLKKALGISYGAMIAMAAVIGIVAAVAGRRAGIGLVMPLGCGTALAALASLIFAIMGLLMLEKFGKRLAEQARVAAETWDAVGMQ